MKRMLSLCIELIWGKIEFENPKKLQRKTTVVKAL